MVTPWRKSTETVKAVVCGDVVDRDHRVEVEPPRDVAGKRRADDAAGVADEEGDLLRGGVDRGEDQVGLILAVVVVADDDDLALSEGADGFRNAVGSGGHSRVSRFSRPGRDG